MTQRQRMEKCEVIGMNNVRRRWCDSLSHPHAKELQPRDDIVWGTAIQSFDIFWFSLLVCTLHRLKRKILSLLLQLRVSFGAKKLVSHVKHYFCGPPYA